jgi:hypothetical protein
MSSHVVKTGHRMGRRRRGLDGLWLVALVLLAGCATGRGTPSVRLETGTGAPRVFAPRAASVPVRLTSEEVREALARLVLEVPLSVRPLPNRPRVVRTLFHPGEAPDALTRDYGQWCERKGQPSDCLELLRERPSLEVEGKRRLALAMGMASAWESAGVQLEAMANPRAVMTSLAAGAAVYLALWLLPEPVSKGLAAALTVALIGYVGLDGFFALTNACRALEREVESARSFAQVHEAGQRFGKRLGPHVARALVTLVGAALGQTASGFAARVPTLPGAAPATVVAEAQLGVNLSTAAEVQSVAVAEQGLVIGLAPGAVAMAAKGTDGEINTVYISKGDDGQVQYAGITNDFARRQAEQLRQRGIRIIRLLKNLSREDARAVEQALIEIHGLEKNGGTLMNRINSIARSNPRFAALLRRGLELLETAGYEGQ